MKAARRNLSLLACTLLAVTAGSSSSATPLKLKLSPEVQVLDQLRGSVPPAAGYLLGGYSFIAVDTTNSANLLAARGLQAAVLNISHLRLAIVPLRSVHSQGQAIVVGALDDPNTTALAAGRNLTASVPSGTALAHRRFSREGYVLDIRAGGIILAGASNAGTFFGCQTLAQIINGTVAAGGQAGHGDVSAMLAAMRITDWPHWSLRGMHVHELNVNRPMLSHRPANSASVLCVHADSLEIVGLFSRRWR